MRENLSNHWRIPDRRNHLEPTVAARTGFHIDIKHPLEQTCPADVTPPPPFTASSGNPPVSPALVSIVEGAESPPGDHLHHPFAKRRFELRHGLATFR